MHVQLDLFQPTEGSLRYSPALSICVLEKTEVI